MQWVSQMDSAGCGSNDCGDALMVLRSPLAREGVFHELQGKTGEADPVNLADEFHLTLEKEAAAMDRLPELIDQNKPVVVAVEYNYLISC